MDCCFWFLCSLMLSSGWYSKQTGHFSAWDFSLLSLHRRQVSLDGMRCFLGPCGVELCFLFLFLSRFLWLGKLVVLSLRCGTLFDLLPEEEELLNQGGVRRVGKSGVIAEGRGFSKASALLPRDKERLPLPP